MTTPRTIAACEVRPNSRISVSIERGPMERHISGPVSAVDTVDGSTWITFRDNRSEEMDAKHPVTVLAEPEPEWVEGAWYRCRMRSGDVRHLQRTADNGWSTTVDGYTAWVDSDGEITVLGRVLIVDWPGGDVARAIERTYTPGGKWIAIAEAIRTQGGAR